MQQACRRIALGAALVASAMASIPAIASAAPFRPTAIAVDSEGFSYAGGPGIVQRYAPGGELVGALPITGASIGSVAAISISEDDHIWIVDQTNRVQEFTRAGVFVRGFDIGSCTRPADTFMHGGVDVSPTHVYAASVCKDEVVRVDRSDFGSRRAWTVTDPHNISFNTFASCGYKLAVTRPQQKDVLLYDADGTQVGSRVVGGRVPDVYLDDFGVVMALDTDREAVHMYGCDGTEFRTLGRPGSGPGDLDNPLGLDVFGQYGGDLAGNLFVAEFNNARVQRWSSGGYTFWARATTDDAIGGGDPGGGDPGGGDPGGGDPGPTTGPVGVSIEAGAVFTAGREVTVTIREPEGATGVLIANDGGFDGATVRALSADDRYTWTLRSSGAERLPKTIYVRFVGGATGLQTFTDDIVLDETAPTLSSATLRSTTLSLSARDATSGVAAVQVATSTKAGARKLTLRYGRKVKVSRKLGRRPLVRVIDRAGNPGKWRRVARR